MHVYEVRPRRDKRGADLIPDALPGSRLWYGEPNAAANAIGYAEHRTMPGFAFTMKLANVIETHEHKGDFREW